MSGGPNPKEFEQIVLNCLNDDNKIRNEAEKKFLFLKNKNPDACVKFLMLLLKDSKMTDVRSMSSSMLRRCLHWQGDDSVYDRLNQNTLQFVKNNLLNLLLNEKHDKVRHHIIYCVSNYIAAEIEKNGQTSYLAAILQWGKKVDNFILMENSLIILDYLCTFIDKKMLNIMDEIKPIIALGLKHSNSKTRIAALRTSCGIIGTSISKGKRKEFQPIVPLMLKVLSIALNEGDIEASKTTLQCFIEICCEEASFFHLNPTRIVYAMFQIAKTYKLDKDIRHDAMEFLCSFCETSSKILQERVPKFLQNIIPLCLEYISKVSFDIVRFNKSYDADDDEEACDYDIGVEALDRIAKSFGGKHLKPIIFDIVSKFGKDSSWKKRVIACRAICQTTEGCKSYYKDHLQSLVNVCIVLLDDKHLRVKYEAIQALAQISTDFDNIFLKQFHSVVFPKVYVLLSDNSPKIKAHAATAIINFIENTTNSQFIVGYLDKILFKLVNSMLKSQIKYVQEQALVTITVIINRSKKYFTKYYPHMIPLLKMIIKNGDIHKDAILRARAIECIGEIAVAVGPKLFSKDANEVIKYLQILQNTKLKNDNPQIEKLRQCWPQIARVLYDKFVPLLPVVIPPLLNLLKQRSEVKISDFDSQPQYQNGKLERSITKYTLDDNVKEGSGYQSVMLVIKGVGNKKITVKTSVLEDKISAIVTLNDYSVHLKEFFFPYVQTIAKLVIPILYEPVLEEIKEEVVILLPHLLQNVIAAAKRKLYNATPNHIKDLFNYIFDSSLKAIKENDDSTNKLIYQLLFICIKNINSYCISNERLEKFFRESHTQLLASLVEKETLKTVLKVEENEEKRIFLEDEIDDNDEFLTTITELIGTIIKYHPKQSVNLFFKLRKNILREQDNTSNNNNNTVDKNIETSLFNTYYKLLDPQNCDPTSNRIALCMFCDFIEYSGVAEKFVDKLFPAFINYCKHQRVTVRHPAFYGIGAFAQYGGNAVAATQCRIAIQVIVSAIQHPDAKSQMDMAATCNAVSALFKYIVFKGPKRENNINIEQLLKIWVGALPVSGDVEEAKIVHRHLIDLFEKGNKVVVQMKQYVVQMVFAKIVNSDVVSEEDKNRIMKIVNIMKSQQQQQM